MTNDFDAIDFLTDTGLLADPYPYYDHLRGQCPVLPTAHRDVVAVTGYEAVSEICRNTDDFSNCITVFGPFTEFSEPFEGDDIGDIIERHRHELPMNEHMVTMDPPMHTRERALLMRLITPKRLQENEEFMWRLADQLIEPIIAAGRCEFIAELSQPFAMLAVADLLGVPEKDHEKFRRGFGLMSSGTGGMSGDAEWGELNSMSWLDDSFIAYVEDRRRSPRHDVLTDLALAKYPDGSTPAVLAVVRTATFLFTAGQETSARLLAQALRFIAGDQELQDHLRHDPSLDAEHDRGDVAHREPGQDRLPAHQTHDERRRRGHRRGHAGHDAPRRGQPRPGPLRVPRRVPCRPAERP